VSIYPKTNIKMSNSNSWFYRVVLIVACSGLVGMAAAIIVSNHHPADAGNMGVVDLKKSEVFRDAFWDSTTGCMWIVKQTSERSSPGSSSWRHTYEIVRVYPDGSRPVQINEQ
jgi:hypothetical protein